MKQRHFLSLVLLSLVAVSGKASFVNERVTIASEASEVSFGEIILPENYQKGLELIVPDVEAKAGSTNLVVQKILHKPNGVSEVIYKTAVLDSVGDFVIEYRAVYDGRVYTRKHTIKTYERMFELSSTSDEAIYCGTTEELVRVLQDRTDMANDYVGSGIVGEFVSLSSGETVTINDYFDITKSSLAHPLVDISIVPAKKGYVDSNKIMHGNYDIKTLIVKMISKKNRSEYLEFRCNYYLSNNGTYFLAGGQNQIPTGWESYSDTYHVGNIWGGYAAGSFVGVPANGRSLADDSLKIWLNYKDKKVYANTQKAYIIDLDDSKCFSNLWKGFTDGDVQIEISGSGYQGTNPAQFVVVGAGDLDISKDVIYDNDGPSISVDYNGYNEGELPPAIVGKPYKVFSATAEDWFSNEVEVTTKVFGRYNSSSRYNIDINNGEFVPTEEGTYVVEYTAKDYSNNITTKVVKINAVNSVSPIVVDLDSVVTECNSGDLVKLPTYTVSGGAGKVSIEKYYSLNGVEYPIEGNEFRPEIPGEYKIIFRATDYAHQVVEKTYTLQVKVNEYPVFVDEIILPKYLVENSEYTLPTAYSYDYSSTSGRKQVNTIVEVKDSNGTHQLSGLKYTPVVNEHLDDVEISYISTVNGKKARSETYKIPTCKVGNGKSLDFTKFFAGDATYGIHSKDIAITTKKDGKVDFINPVIADGFSITFDIDEHENYFSKVNILLTDAKDGTTLKSSFTKKPGNTSFWTINDGDPSIINSSFDGNGIASFDFTYLAENNLIKNGGSDITLPVTNKDGSAFKGFASGLVYVSIEFENVISNSTILLKNLGGQAFGSLTADTVKPRLSLLNSISMSYNIDDEVTLPAAVAADVLDPNVKAHYSVFNPDGDIIKDINGKELSEVALDAMPTIKLDKYGVYYVEFYAVDWNMKAEINFVYALEVVDKVAPEITFIGDRITTAKVGDNVKVQEVEVNDGLDGKIENVGIFVITPDGVYKKVERETFMAEKAGIYTVVYYAYDSSGNTVRATYTVRVEA